MFNARTIQHGYQFGMGKDDTDWYICVPEQHWKNGGSFEAEHNGDTQTFKADAHVKEITQTSKNGGEYKTRYYLWAEDVPAEPLPWEVPVTITIPRGTSPDTLRLIGTILKGHPGEQQVTIVITGGDADKRIELPYKVAYDGVAKKAIEAII
jgi:hypothetical protein